MLRKIFIPIFILIISPVLQADVPESQRAEVEHLFHFIQQSDCIFERNGKQYPAAEAVEHIKNKYDYFRDRIKSTEEFIEYSATKSTMSGRMYYVYCPGKERITSQQWLLTELKHYRQQQRQ